MKCPLSSVGLAVSHSLYFQAPMVNINGQHTAEFHNVSLVMFYLYTHVCVYVCVSVCVFINGFKRSLIVTSTVPKTGILKNFE